jgi:aspartyl protease family protein
MWRMAILIIFVGTLVGALMPSGPAPSADGKRQVIRVDSLDEGSSASTSSDGLALQRSFDGHFYADAQVNGATVHFLVDTGATGIALSVEDARRAGLTFSASDAEVVGTGASGEVKGRWVELDRVELGSRSATDTPAIILAGGDRSLLGQSFLSKFDSVEVHGNTMVLR